MKFRKRAVLPLAAVALLCMLIFGSNAFATGQKKAPDSAAQQSSASVDLNSASQKDLEALPGVGPATAKKIIAGRPYASVDDLKKAGVSSSTIEKIRSQVTASASSSASPATAAATPQPTQPTPPATASKGSMRSEEKAAKSSGMPQQDNATPPPAGSGMVWVNLDSKVYHREGDRWYGKTKHGKYMSESDAQKEGYRPSKEK
jgi:cell division septation protein DedD